MHSPPPPTLETLEKHMILSLSYRMSHIDVQLQSSCKCNTFRGPFFAIICGWLASGHPSSTHIYGEDDANICNGELSCIWFDSLHRSEPLRYRCENLMVMCCRNAKTIPCFHMPVQLVSTERNMYSSYLKYIQWGWFDHLDSFLSDMDFHSNYRESLKGGPQVVWN